MAQKVEDYKKFREDLRNAVRKNPQNLLHAFKTVAAKYNLSWHYIADLYYGAGAPGTKCTASKHKLRRDLLGISFITVGGKSVGYNVKNASKNSPKYVTKTKRSLAGYLVDLFKKFFKK